MSSLSILLPSPQILVLGQPGEEVSLELILRVVADVALVVCATVQGLFNIFTCVRTTAIHVE